MLIIVIALILGSTLTTETEGDGEFTVITWITGYHCDCKLVGLIGQMMIISLSRGHWLYGVRGDDFGGVV